MSAKTPLNPLGKFIAVLTINYDITIGEMEELLNLPTNSLNNIGRQGTRRIDERFLKLPSVLGLTPEETEQFQALVKEYNKSVKPNGKYPMNPLGEFIRHIQLERNIKNNHIEQALGLKENYLGGLMRRRMVSLNSKFLRFPEVFHLTNEETEKFRELCDKYQQARPADGYGRSQAAKIPERLVPLLEIIKHNAFVISDAAIHACVSCLERDIDRNLQTGEMDGQ